jgi:hypothetical protein
MGLLSDLYCSDKVPVIQPLCFGTMNMCMVHRVKLPAFLID